MFENLNITKKQLYIATGIFLLFFLLGVVFTILNIKHRLESNRNNTNIVLPSKNTSVNTNSSSYSNSSQFNINTNVASNYQSSASINIGNVSLSSEEGKEIKRVLDNFFKDLNDKRYDILFSHLHPYFIDKNHITVEKVQNYFQKEYPSSVNYKIDFISEENYVYHTRIIVSDKNVPMDDFNANFYFEKINGIFKVNIPHMTQTL